MKKNPALLGEFWIYIVQREYMFCLNYWVGCNSLVCDMLQKTATSGQTRENTQMTMVNFYAYKPACASC